MGWTDPTTRSTDDLITASIWNTDLVDNLAFLLSTINPDSLTNKSGGALEQGDVVVGDGGNDNAFTTTTTANDPDILGVVMENIANDATGRVAVMGVITVKVQGNVTRGNYLCTSTTAKRAADAGTIPAVGTFAKALTAYSGGAAGTVTAILMPAAAGGGAVPGDLVAYTSAGSAPTGYSEYTSARGRVIVGLPSGGTNEGTVGTALTDQQDKTHTHVYSTTVQHLHTVKTTSTGGTGYAQASGSGTEYDAYTENAGSASPSTAATSHMMPYIQLMAIEKS